MNYTFHENTDEKLLDAFVVNSDQNSIFQCSNWAKVKNNWNHYLTSMTDENENIVASALILTRDFPLGKKLFYIPRGPILDYHNTELVGLYFSKIKELAKKDNAIAVIFDPKIYSRRYPYHNRMDDIPLENEDIIQTLKNLGAEHKGYTKMINETYQPRFNAEMDVEEDYMEKMDRKTVRSIERAYRRGAEIYEGREYLDDFCEAMHYTEVRKNVALRNKEYFQNMIDVYQDKCILAVAKLNFPKQMEICKNRLEENKNALTQEGLTKKQKKEIEKAIGEDEDELKKLQEDYEAEGKDEIVLTGILGLFNDKMMELAYMGNNPRSIRLRASYAIYNHCLDYCAKHGIRECSFGGIEGTLDDGLTIFKSNFIMNVEEYIGEFTFVLQPTLFHLFDSVYPKAMNFLLKFRK